MHSTYKIATIPRYIFCRIRPSVCNPYVLRDHPYIISAYFWPFWTPPTHLTSINTVLNVSKTHFLDPPTHPVLFLMLYRDGPLCTILRGHSTMTWTKFYPICSPLSSGQTWTTIYPFSCAPVDFCLTSYPPVLVHVVIE